MMLASFDLVRGLREDIRLVAVDTPYFGQWPIGRLLGALMRRAAP